MRNVMRTQDHQGRTQRRPGARRLAQAVAAALALVMMPAGLLPVAGAAPAPIITGDLGGDDSGICSDALTPARDALASVVGRDIFQCPTREEREAAKLAELQSRTKLPLSSVYPNGNTVMGVGQPVILRFSVPPNKNLVKKVLTVQVRNRNGEVLKVPGRLRWYGDREVRWRPLKFWPAHTSVTVKAGNYTRNFRIGARRIAVADDKTKQIKVYVDGKLVRTVPTSLGKPKHETPRGFYYISEKHRKIVMDSSTYGVPVDDPEGYKVDVEYALRMSSSGIFLHAAPWSVAAQGAYNSSHGCLNVSTDNGRWFYENWDYGDVVRVINTQGPRFSSQDYQGDWADL